MSILINKNLSQFTAVELKKMFINQVPDTKNKEAVQLIHRTLNRLCCIEFLKKQNNGKKVVFSKTLAFDEGRLSPSKPRAKSPLVTEINANMIQSQKLCMLRMNPNTHFGLIRSLISV